jgi:cobalt/nickel transport system permease protein
MVCDTFTRGHSPIHRLDPRTRILAAAAFSLVTASSQRFPVLAACLALAIVAALVARLPWGATARRMAAVNVFVLVMWCVVPWTADGPDRVSLGPLSASLVGVRLAATITLKANAIVLGLTVFLGTVDATSLGHALRHLRMPGKLTHLFLFTVRYLDELRHESSRLHQAMKVRCFRPGMNRHTYRSLGYMVGMLLVNSHDRSERIVAAMKCRGFRGQFYVLDHFAFSRRDLVFGVAASLVFLALILAEWS